MDDPCDRSTDVRRARDVQQCRWKVRREQVQYACHIVEYVAEEMPSFAVRIERCREAPGEENAADHSRAVSQEPNDGGRQRGRGFVTDAHCAEESVERQSTGDGETAGLEDVVHLVDAVIDAHT